MDTLEAILERITQKQAEREKLVQAVEAKDKEIAKLEQLYYMLEDPATEELLRDVVVGMSVQAGLPVSKHEKDGNTTEARIVGMQRVRDFVFQRPPGATFSVKDIYDMSVAHRGHGDAKFNHPKFEEQRCASIALGLSSMARNGEIEEVSAGRDRRESTYRRVV